jgi:glyoxylase-like metal-dependent hydrolase (beta-lactamase superfamily II)
MGWLMMLEVICLTLGPLPNNVYLLGSNLTGDAVVIDPSFESERVFEVLKQKDWQARQVWLTHGHFDHIAGASKIASSNEPPLPIGLHPGDIDWYENAGGANRFGLSISQPPKPSIAFSHNQVLNLGDSNESPIRVLHAPGHSPGHVMFFCPSISVLFCGDVIFRGGIGRTDLPGGDFETLITSIKEQVYILPEETRLLPGHGPESTVGYEKVHNPFVGS